MKFLISILFLSNPAFAQDVWNRTCFTANPECFGVHVVTSGSTPKVTIYAPANLLTNEDSAEIRNDFVAAGFQIAMLTPQIEEKMAQANAKTAVVENDNESHILADIPDEEWNLVVSGSACGISSAICVAGVWSTVTTAGLNLWVARLGCASTVISCASAWRDYEKWKIWANEQKRKKAKDAAASAGESGPVSIDRPSDDEPNPLLSYSNCRKVRPHVEVGPEVSITVTYMGEVYRCDM